jgi:hypothetical protein
MHFHRHQPCPPPIRSIASDQIGYGQRYLIDIENAAIFGVNGLVDGTYLHAETFSIRAPFLHIEVAHVSIGVHNEYFLYHRRRGRNPLCCRLLRTARLNEQLVSDDQHRNDPPPSRTLPL